MHRVQLTAAEREAPLILPLIMALIALSITLFGAILIVQRRNRRDLGGVGDARICRPAMRPPIVERAEGDRTLSR